MVNFLIYLHPILFLFLQSDLKQVATYSVSEYGKPKYEEFSFWVNDKNQPIINYNYGKDCKEAKVVYLGKFYCLN